jgi:stage V sporulation protein B
VIIIYYFARKDSRGKKADPLPDNQRAERILKDIVKLSIPIFIGASVMPLMQLADSKIVTFRLESLGYASDSALSLFGIFSYFANNIINVPGTVSLAFGVSLLPIVSAAKSSGHPEEVKRNSRMGLKMAVLVGMPSAVGLGVLARPIMQLLYGNTLTAQQLPLAGQLLAILAGGVIFLSILQTLNGALQGLGRVIVPVVSLGTGAVAKIVLAYWLIGIPGINIYGAAISTFACYLVAAVIDIIMVKRLTGVKFGFAECVLRPSAASIFMGAAAWGTYALLTGVIGNSFATLSAVLAGVIIFIICIPVLKVMRRTEITALPGGGKMVKIYDALSGGNKDA